MNMDNGCFIFTTKDLLFHLNELAASLDCVYLHCEKVRSFLQYSFLSHNNPCLPCNIVITNFLVFHTCMKDKIS